MHKAVTVGANLHCLIYNVLTDIVSLYILPISSLYKISDKSMLETRGLVALNETQRVC